MKKLKMFDFLTKKWRSTKIFNSNRPNPLDLNDLMNKIEQLTIEQATLEKKEPKSFQDQERIAFLKKEINALANRDTGQRYFEVTYGK